MSNSTAARASAAERLGWHCRSAYYSVPQYECAAERVYGHYAVLAHMCCYVCSQNFSLPAIAALHKVLCASESTALT